MTNISVSPDISTLTRRDFLTVSGATLALGTFGEYSHDGRSYSWAVSPADVVLSSTDLIVPAGVAYTEWSIDVQDAALVRHLAERLPWFRPVEGAASGFVADDASRAPLYVESGAVALDRIGSRRALLGAVDEWFRVSHPGVEVSVGEAAGGVVWTATDAGWVDTLWVAMSNGLVAFVGVCGRIQAEIDSLTSLSLYVKHVHL